MKWIVWLLASAYSFYEFFVRVGPSVIVSDLMKEFNIEATDIGSISASYFYAYAFMQIPVGILLDRFGTRILLTAAAFTCGLSSICFGLSSNELNAVLSRVLMGASSAFGFIGMIYVTAQWFEPKKTSLLIGIGNSLGTFGAAIGAAMLGSLVVLWGWRHSFIVIGLIGFALALFIAIFAKNKVQATTHKQSTLKELLQGLILIMKNAQMWVIAVVAFLAYAAFDAFGSIWGNTFLQNVYHLDYKQAGLATSMIFIGLICGGPLWGYIAKHAHHKKLVLFISSLISLLAILPIIYLTLPLELCIVLIFVVGFCAGGQLITFSMAIVKNPCHAKATAVAFVNFMVFVGVSVVQPLVGILLDLMWDKTLIKGIPHYSEDNYRYALVVLPITLLLACLLTLKIDTKSLEKTH
ncbi:MAG: MFS transporter [Parachlamydiales bacterium]|nr:MFS transporter [Parachlamydiales bacterium]